MNWIDYKKLLNEESKIAIELDGYDDKWMRDYNDKRMRDYDDNGCVIIMINGWRLTVMILMPRSIVGVSQQPFNALAQLYSILQEEIYTS